MTISLVSATATDAFEADKRELADPWIATAVLSAQNASQRCCQTHRGPSGSRTVFSASARTTPPIRLPSHSGYSSLRQP